MMWLSRNTIKYWTAFAFKNGKLILVICDQVTYSSGSLTFSSITVTSTNEIPTIQGKRIMDSTT